MERTLQVTGKGNLALTPDLVIIAFDVNAQEWEYAKTVTRLNDKTEQLRQLLEQENLDRKLLKTKDFNVHRDSSWNKKTEKSEFNGFKASHKLELELPLDQAMINRFLGRIAGSLDDLDFRISFGVKDAAPHHQKLIQNAIRKAKESVVLIAETSGVTLKEILNIDATIREIQIRSRSYDYRLYETENLYEAATPDFEPDDIDVSESVTLTWRIE